MIPGNKLFSTKGKLFGTEPSKIVKDALAQWTHRPNALALDIGAYTGRNSIFLAKQGFRVIALDPADKPLAEIRASGLPVEIVVETLEKFRWTHEFDCIVCVNVLHLLTPEDAERAISTMQRHTLSGGVNVLTVFTSKPFKNQRNVFAPDALKESYEDWTILENMPRTAKLAAGGTAEVVDFIAVKPRAN